jgi:Holliday junction resolvase
VANASKAKGTRVERELVQMHRQQGIPCIRVPLSGAGSISGDLKIGPKHEFTAEVKSRKNGEGFQTLERWMKGCEVLILKRDRQEPMVCMSWQVYSELMAARVGEE